MIPRRDLNVHKAGKAIMRELYPNLIESDNPRQVTHIDPKNGLFIRQKTDLYKFVNFFLEEYSVYHDRAIGGPFQAFQDGCNSYCYYYPQAGKIIWTRLTEESVQKLTDLMNQHRFNKRRIRYIPNNGYLTKGYLINIWEYLNWIDNDCDLVDTAPRNLQQLQEVQL